jgi:hypothetical protein
MFLYFLIGIIIFGVSSATLYKDPFFIKDFLKNPAFTALVAFIVIFIWPAILFILIMDSIPRKVKKD